MVFTDEAAGYKGQRASIKLLVNTSPGRCPIDCSASDALLPRLVSGKIRVGEQGTPLTTLEAARPHNPTLFSTEDEHGGTDENGQPIIIPEEWTVNDKGNLCEWICENGTKEDFEYFQVVFDIIEEALEPAH